MTIADEGKQIRSEVAKLRPDKRRRYSDELRTRILDWVDRATASGMIEPECSKAIGVKTWRFTMWRRAAAKPKTKSLVLVQLERRAAVKPKAESLALVQLDAPCIEVGSQGLSVVAPSGYRVEGLALAQAIVLLRELA